MTANPSKPLLGPDTKLCMSLAARPGKFGTRFHNRLYEMLGLDFVYKAFSTTDLAAAIGGVRALHIRGCAISMPFKEAVIPMLDELKGSAAAIDSVNTIVNDEGHLSGYNTDYSAIVDLLARSGADKSQPFLLHGAGGMAKAVAAALRDSGFTHGTIIARNEARGTMLAQSYGYLWASNAAQQKAALLINATPLGMAGPDAGALAFPVKTIENAACIFDVVALPAETPLIKLAHQHKKKCISGAEVAVLQAVEQFVLYTGVRPTPSQIGEAAAFARSA